MCVDCVANLASNTIFHLFNPPPLSSSNGIPHLSSLKVCICFSVSFILKCNHQNKSQWSEMWYIYDKRIHSKYTHEWSATCGTWHLSYSSFVPHLPNTFQTNKNYVPIASSWGWFRPLHAFHLTSSSCTQDMATEQSFKYFFLVLMRPPMPQPTKLSDQSLPLASSSRPRELWMPLSAYKKSLHGSQRRCLGLHPQLVSGVTTDFGKTSFAIS
jgi:hypothetical protein